MNHYYYAGYENDLLVAISLKKKEMIELGMKYGLTDNRTVECSQELDDLMNSVCEKLILAN